MSNYLVTGVAGFIGSHVAQKLLVTGNKVLGIDNFNPVLYGDLQKKDRLKDLLPNKNFKFIEDDLLDMELDLILSKIDFIINEAGLPGQHKSWNQISEYFNANTIATARLFDAASRSNVKGFLQASTSSVYGNNAIGIEDQSLNPASPYGVSKLAAENLIKAMTPYSSMKTVILRYFSVYGPSQRPDMGMFKFFEAIREGKPINVYGDGEQTRDFTYVSDVVNATILSLEQGLDGEIYNVSGGQQISINKLIELLEKTTNKKIEVIKVDRPKGDQLNTQADTSKIRKYISWKPEIALEEGLRKQYFWHNN
jgi:UDP-glucose 4-epimerase